MLRSCFDDLYVVISKVIFNVLLCFDWLVIRTFDFDALIK